MTFHDFLLSFAKYYSSDFEGTCHGFTMRWLEAQMLGYEQAFMNRMNYLSKNFDEMHAIYQSGVYPSDPRHRDIMAFIESMVIFQKIYNYKYFPKTVPQSDIELSSVVASSESIQKLGGLAELTNDQRILTKDELTNHLQELAEIFEAIDPKITKPITMLFSFPGHAMSLSYEVGKGWKFMDINQYPPIKVASGDERLISESVFKEYSQSFTQIPLTFRLISTKNNPDNKVLKEKLTKFQDDYEITEDIAKREGVTSLLWAAASSGNVSLVEKLLSKGADVNNPNKDTGATPLLLACQNGRLEVVKLLINANADLFKKGNFGTNALMHASSNGHIDIVLLLLDTNPDIIFEQTDGMTAFWIACQAGHLEIAKLLAAKGANIFQKKTPFESSPLHVACETGQLDVVKWLVEQGADFTELTAMKESPLQIAIKYGHFRIAKFLLEEEAANLNMPPLGLACQRGELEIIELLLKDGAAIDEVDKNGNTPFLLACQSGNLQVVELLAAKGANLYKTNQKGESPFLKVCENNKIEIAKWFISKIDVNDKSQGQTMLGCACKTGSLEIVKLLIENGANINQPSRLSTPFAIACANGHAEVVKLLLEHNVKISSQNPFFEACAKGHLSIVRLLLDKVDINQKNSSGFSPLWIACQSGQPEIFRLLLVKGAVLEKEDKNGNTLFGMVCKSGHIEIAKDLADLGVDILKKDANGKSPLALALESGHINVVKWLFEKGVPYDVDTNINRLLLNACEKNRLDLVALLHEKGANLNETDPDGFSPIFIAIQNGNSVMLDYLLTNGANSQYSVTLPVEYLLSLSTKESVMDKIQNFIDENILRQGETDSVKITPVDLAKILEKEEALDLLTKISPAKKFQDLKELLKTSTPSSDTDLDEQDVSKSPG